MNRVAVVLACALIAGCGGSSKKVDDSKRKVELEQLAAVLGLGVAASNGDVAGIERILAGGVDVNTRLADDETALIQAAQGGHAEAVDFLISKGADINARSSKGDTALTASRPLNASKVKILEALLKHGANPNDLVGDMPLLFRAEVPDVVRLLAKNGADPNGKTSGNGASALMYFIARDNPDLGLAQN